MAIDRTEWPLIEQNGCRSSWYIMIYHDIFVLHIMKYHDKLLPIMIYHDLSKYISWYILIYHDISWHFVMKIKNIILSRKHVIMVFLSRKFMITRLSIAFEDFLGSLIAPQVMPPWLVVRNLMVQGGEILGWAITEGAARCPRSANFRPLLLSFL